MIGSRIPAMRSQALIGLSLFGLSLWLAWELSGKIVANDFRMLEFGAVGCVGIAAAFTILRNWRTGFYIFFVWMMFEDLFRKYMGNGPLLFFGKDILAGLLYISLLIEIRKGKEKAFRPPFLFFLALFFWLGVLQIFNQNSPSIFFGLLGFKVYFYYIPMMFAGYALMRSDEDLRKFLAVNLIIAGTIASIGIAQAIVGNSFMNPEHLDPALQELGDLNKVTPLTYQIFSLPDSVFVSAGRFGEYLIAAFILSLGTAAYLLLSTHRNRILAFSVIALLGVATLLSGSRGVVLWVLISMVVLSVGFLWGAPWRFRQAHRLVRAIRLSVIVGVLGLGALLVVFPNQAGSRIAYYAETLLPSSSAYEVTDRSWNYPIQNLMDAFTEPHWVVGEGIGTASLGAQYVARLTGIPQPPIWVEEGYGVLIAEMGIVAPFLWLLWTAALLFYSWRILRQLRQTRYFPIALVIFWFAFLVLYPRTYGTMSTYQDYTCNIFLWFLTGVLFRLPDLAAKQLTPSVISGSSSRTNPEARI
jgi:hypothetical protein